MKVKEAERLGAATAAARLRFEVALRNLNEAAKDLYGSGEQATLLAQTPYGEERMLPMTSPCRVQFTPIPPAPNYRGR